MLQRVTVALIDTVYKTYSNCEIFSQYFITHLAVNLRTYAIFLALTKLAMAKTAIPCADIHGWTATAREAADAYERQLVDYIRSKCLPPNSLGKWCLFKNSRRD